MIIDWACYWFKRVILSYVFIGSFVLIEWFGMVGAIGGGNELAAGIYGACTGYWGYQLVNKYRKGKYEHRYAETYDLRGADPGPPYLATAGRDEHWSAIQGRPSGTYRTCSCPLCTGKATATWGAGEGTGLVPDSVVPLVGYRSWLCSPDGFLAGPISPDLPWKVGINVATCLNEARMSSHHVASRGCSCGFYAYKDEGDLEMRWFRDVYVCGRVELFGMVTEHSIGYRASHARITGIYNTGPLARQMAKLYEAELLPVPGVVRRLREYVGI